MCQKKRHHAKVGGDLPVLKFELTAARRSETKIPPTGV